MAMPDTYEDFVRASAARRGATVTGEGDGLLVTMPDGLSSWHRLGGIAEDMYDARKNLNPDGRWVGLHQLAWEHGKVIDPTGSHGCTWMPNSVLTRSPPTQ